MEKEVKAIVYGEPSRDTHRQISNGPPPQNTTQQQTNEPCFSGKIKIATFIIGPILIIGIIVLVILLLRGGSEDSSPKPIEIIPNNTNPYKLETEFEFVNKVQEPYQINVEQKYNEEILTNGIKTTQFVDRKTNYHIFIMNVTNATEETKNLYSKLYTAAILISSQCQDTESENCEPQQMMDLTKISKRNLRSLDSQIPDLKDIPLPICLFNITDNDVITSMKCPESLHQNIRQAMILDLYFFRPPAIKRPEKEASNVTITKDKRDGKEFIRETNGGICDVPDALESFCTTEMNTTTDLEGNILTYDEIAFTNITHDKDNYYIKNKITNLKDETEKITNIDINAYKESLEIIIEKLKPYLKYYEEFSLDEFKELYRISKNITEENPKQRRNLYQQTDESTAIGEDLFEYKHYTQTKINLNLINDPFYSTIIMRAAFNVMINEDQREITGSQANLNFSSIVKKLRVLSKSGNSRAKELYDNSQYYLDIVDDIILDNITSLIKSIVNEDIKSLSFIFDSTLNIGELSVYPMKLVQETTNLKNNLNNIFNNIINGGMKRKLNILNENINSFLSESHMKLDNVFQNVRSLSKSLRSSKSRLTEIATIYLNHTNDSFSDIIDNIQELLLNYYKNEGGNITGAVNTLIDNFIIEYNKSILKEKNKIINLTEIIEKNYMNINIENGTEEDKSLFLSNLKDSIEIYDSIIIKVEELIKKEMNLKENGHFITNNEIKTTNNSYFPDVEEALETAILLDNDESVDKLFDKTFEEMKDNYTSIMINQQKKIQENSVFSDGVLEYENGLFSKKEDIEKNISTLSREIIGSVNNENDDYLKKASEAIDTFIKKNNETLIELINNIIAMFSDDIFIDLVNQYDKAFESCLKTIDENIETNKILIENYFSSLSGIFFNDTEIIEFLKILVSYTLCIFYKFQRYY